MKNIKALFSLTMCCLLVFFGMPLDVTAKENIDNSESNQVQTISIPIVVDTEKLATLYWWQDNPPLILCSETWLQQYGGIKAVTSKKARSCPLTVLKNTVIPDENETEVVK